MPNPQHRLLAAVVDVAAAACRCDAAEPLARRAASALSRATGFPAAYVEDRGLRSPVAAIVAPGHPDIDRFEFTGSLPVWEGLTPSLVTLQRLEGFDGRVPGNDRWVALCRSTGPGSALVVMTPEVGEIDGELGALLEALAMVVEAGVERSDVMASLLLSERRLIEAQELAHLGSYDWNILNDVNEWSDELYRIYGTEPQSFNASYERFLGFIHPDDRERVQKVHQDAYATGEPYRMEERIVRSDGSVRTLASSGEVLFNESGEPVRMVGVCLDITELRRAEEVAHTAQRAEDRRRQALDLNDQVVQGLVTAMMALDSGIPDAAADAIRSTLASATSMMDSLMESADSPYGAGDFVRDRPVGHVVEPEHLPRPVADLTTADGGSTKGRRGTVVIADDAEDLRVILRITLEREGFEVVAEAGDGRKALEAVTRTRPSLLLLDVSMPLCDGIETLPLVREAASDTQVVVMSGFTADALKDRAIGLGAVAYLEKSGGTDELFTLLDSLFPVTPASASSPA